MALRATILPYTAKCVRGQIAVTPMDKSRNGFIPAITFLVVLLIAGAIFYIGTHVKVVNLGYKINGEMQKKETLIEDNKRLKLQIARLQSPTRIEKEALEQLGLALPKPNQIVSLSRWEEVEARQPAVPADPQKPAPVATAKPFPATVKQLPAPVKAPPLPVKKSPEVIVATLVAPRAEKNPLALKGSAGTASPVKRKESVPAVMLDPMP